MANVSIMNIVCFATQDLKDHMRSAGTEVCYADAHRDRRNEGYVSVFTVLFAYV